MQQNPSPYNDPNRPSVPPISSPTDFNPAPMMGAGGPNNSGMGAQSVLPPELRGVNWGGFLLTLFWSISHNTWIGLLCLVPYLGGIMSFVVLFKGNEWAWQNRRWDSIEQFKEVQAKWTMWGLIIAGIGIALYIVAMVIGASFRPPAPGGIAPPA